MAENSSLKALSHAIYQIADTQLKKIQPDVEKMREAICGSDGIRELITSINNSIQERNKQLNVKEKSRVLELKKTQRLFKFTSSVEKLLQKILAHIEKMDGGRVKLKDTKDTSKKIKKLDKMSKSLEVVERLRGISIKDLLFAGIKIKKIKNIVKKFKSMFKIFKSPKEAERTMSFAESSIEIMKKLAKLAVFAKPAKLGAKVIEKIFLGSKKKPGGLLHVFRELHRHQRQIKKGKKLAKSILVAAGSLFLTAILLTGIAALAIPALLGALALKGIIWLLTGTFKLLRKATKNVLLGSLVLLVMSASVITFALGLGFMVKAVKDMKWKDFGMMMASIGAIGVVLAVLGIPPVAALIALGSVALLVAGAALIVFGLGLRKTVDSVKGMKWKDLGMMMANIGAIGVAMAGFGIMSFLILPGSIALLTTGLALGTFAKSIKEWMDMKNIKPALTNIKIAVKSVRKIIKGKFDKKAINRLSDAGEALFDLFIGLKGWDTFNGKKAAENIRETISTLQDLLKVRIEKKFIKPYKKIGKVLRRLYKGLKGWDSFNATKAASNIETTIGTLNTTFQRVNLDKGMVKQMKTLSRATKNLSSVITSLKLWENFVPQNSVENIRNTVDKLLAVFGLSELEQKKVEEAVSEGGFWTRLKKGVKNIGESIGTAVTGIMDNVNEGIKGRGIKNKMQTLADIMSSLNIVRLYLKFWEKYYPAKGIENVNNTMDSLLKQIVDAGEYESQAGGSIRRPVLAKYFRKTAKDIRSGLEALSKGYAKLNKMDPSIGPFKSTVSAINELDVSKATTMIDLFKSFAKIGIRPFDKFTNAVHEFSDSCNKLIDALNENNLSEENFISPSYNEKTGSYDMGRGVSISNTDDLAQAIANAIRSIPLNVETNMSDVRLVVDGEPGRRVVLSLEN